MTRIAVISDMHGNLTAFRAALEDAERQSVDEIWCGGDLVGKGPRGRAVVELAREACSVAVRGNWDEVIAEPETAPWRPPDWYRDELGEDALAWLAALPFHHDRVLGGRAVRLFHASADSVHHRVHAGADDDAFDAMFAATTATGDVGTAGMVVYGDLHDQFLDIRRGRWLVNCGSAGNALDGDTAAAYIVLDAPDERSLSVRFHRVAYDVEEEIAVARSTDLPFLVHWLDELRLGEHRRRG